MPKKKFRNGPPVYDKKGAVGVFRAVITHVDPLTYTCSVKGQDGEVFEGLALQSQYSGANGQGSSVMPETNSVVWLMRPSNDVDPFVFMSCALPKQFDEGDDAEDPNNYRMNRPVLNEGDQILSSQDGNFIILRRGGVIEIGASQTAQRFYIPIQNIIRDFCKGYELVTAGGTMSFKSRTDDDTNGEDVTPVEFNLQIKEFSQNAPLIELALGRIEAENDLRVSGGLTGDIIAKLVINNGFKYFVDREGNVNSYTHGASIHSYNGPSTDFYATSFFHRVKGLLLGNYGTRHVTNSGSDVQIIGGSRSVAVGGDETHTVAGSVSRTTGRIVEEVKGSVERTVKGTVSDRITGNLEQVVAGASSLQVADDLNQVVVGKREEFVINSQLSRVAYSLYVTLGEINIHDAAGTVQFSSGGPLPDAALAKIKLKPTGAIVLKSTFGVVQIEMNASGISISTAAGKIEMDNLGTLLLGPPGRGGVVTTATHPFDYVTGLPILGSSSVQAGGVPAPAPVGLLSTFIPTEI